MTDLANRNYIHWDADGVTHEPAGEKEEIQKVADMFNDIQRVFYNQHRHCFGGEFMTFPASVELSTDACKVRMQGLKGLSRASFSSLMICRSTSNKPNSSRKAVSTM